MTDAYDTFISQWRQASAEATRAMNEEADKIIAASRPRIQGRLRSVLAALQTEVQADYDEERIQNGEQSL